MNEHAVPSYERPAIERRVAVSAPLNTVTVAPSHQVPSPRWNSGEQEE